MAIDMLFIFLAMPIKMVSVQKSTLSRPMRFYTVGAKLNAEHTKERQHNAQALQTISLSYHQKLEANALATLFLTALYTK